MPKRRPKAIIAQNGHVRLPRAVVRDRRHAAPSAAAGRQARAKHPQVAEEGIWFALAGCAGSG